MPDGFTRDRSWVICPHCRWPNKEPQQGSFLEDWFTMECGYCRKPFQVQVEVTTSYVARVKPSS